MIRLLNIRKEPFWVNPKCIDLVKAVSEGAHSTYIWFHSGSSCMNEMMLGSVDDVKKMIDEAKEWEWKQVDDNGNS